MDRELNLLLVFHKQSLLLFKITTKYSKSFSSIRFPEKITLVEDYAMLPEPKNSCGNQPAPVILGPQALPVTSTFAAALLSLSSLNIGFTHRQSLLKKQMVSHLCQVQKLPFILSVIS